MEVNLDAIKANITELKNLLTSEKKVFAAIKANAYGHGDVQVAQAAMDAGVDGFAVALLDEAIRLRKYGVHLPILVMGYVKPEFVQIAADHNITLTAFQSGWLKEAKKYLLHKTVAIHVKFDTGMGRIGIRTEEELQDFINQLTDSRFFVEGVYTHFATADEEDLTYYETQQTRFQRLLSIFQESVVEPVTVHTGNSAAGMRFPQQMFHAVRFGISMYGLYPSSQVKREHPMPLQPALSLHSTLSHIKQLPKGEFISYGATYETKGNEWIGTIPLGYGDGWIRKLNKADVLIDGKRMPIVGRICMDQFMVRLDRFYPVGTKVTLIGRQEKEEITVDEVAQHLDTISYEVPCMINGRVPRVYLENGQIKQTFNQLTTY
ncbi:alanine racemase [Salirhabdus salicampi]|nr:alanine racemase [Salirhabdus salicampi]MCP8618092.1 alanine racemase [Salirhabdus salicampi]